MDVAGTDDLADDTAAGRAGTMTQWYGPIHGLWNGDGRTQTGLAAGRLSSVAYLISTPTTAFQRCVISVMAALS